MAQQEVQNGGAQKVDAVSAATFSSVKPHLYVGAPKAADAIQFYKSAFGAEELVRIMHSKRKAEQEHPLILYAQLKIADSVIIVCDHADDSSAPEKAPAATAVSICLETENVDAAVAQAVAAGAVSVTEDEAGAGGDERVGTIQDPYGFVWVFCSPAKKDDDVEA